MALLTYERTFGSLVTGSVPCRVLEFLKPSVSHSIKSSSVESRAQYSETDATCDRRLTRRVTSERCSPDPLLRSGQLSGVFARDAWVMPRSIWSSLRHVLDRLAGHAEQVGDLGHGGGRARRDRGPCGGTRRGICGASDLLVEARESTASHSAIPRAHHPSVASAERPAARAREDAT